jgi:hypothetical protein
VHDAKLVVDESRVSATDPVGVVDDPVEGESLTVAVHESPAFTTADAEQLTLVTVVCRLTFRPNVPWLPE